MGIMLVYDVTNDKSFENIKNWIRNIEEHASSDVEKMILGNKCDVHDRRQVSRERGEQLAIEYGIKFMETSAKASINVEDAFFTLAKDIKTKMEKKLVSNATEDYFCPPLVSATPFPSLLNHFLNSIFSLILFHSFSSFNGFVLKEGMPRLLFSINANNSYYLLIYFIGK